MEGVPYRRTAQRSFLDHSIQSALAHGANRAPHPLFLAGKERGFERDPGHISAPVFSELVTQNEHGYICVARPDRSAAL